MSAPNNNRITELTPAASRGDLSRAEALPRDEWTALMIAERKGHDFPDHIKG